VLAAIAIGLADLAWHAWRGVPAAREVAVAFAATLAATALLGLAVALLARLVPRAMRDAAPWTACLAVYLGLALAARLDVLEGSLARNLAVALAAVLCAAILWRALAPLAARVPILARPGAWGAACVGALLALGAAALRGREARVAPEAASHPPNAPSALLVTIDTLRADRVGAYGCAEARTPAMDELARRGALFEQAISHSVLTGPSHVSILSGLLPVQHGVLENLAPLARDVPTLAERLGELGWRTGAFVAGYPLKQDASRLLERFREHDDDFRELQLLPELAYATAPGRLARSALQRSGFDMDPRSRDATAVTEAALAWLEQVQGPFFAWVHYFDPHLPYEPPRRLLSAEARAYRGPAGGGWYGFDAGRRQAIVEDPSAIAHMLELYDAEVAHADEQLGRLVAAARERAGPGGLWTFVTADHGESFGEHGIWFERDLYDDCLRVPLIVAPPGTRAFAAGRRVAEQVRLVDIAPSVLDALGQTSALRTEGTSLVPLIGEKPPPGPGPALSLVLPTRGTPFRRPAQAVRDGRFKAIFRQSGWDRDGSRWRGTERELYDLERDPLELDDLALERPEVFERLEDLVQDLRIPLSTRPLDPRERAVLQSLGYTQ
jgi:arylsulfatase A-like enzyme